MVRVITVDDVSSLLRKVTLKTFLLRLIDQLKLDFADWACFELKPRVATHYHDGVIELMPVSNQEYYSFKYVNGHPSNPGANKLTVVAVGMLADIRSGYPVLLSEMTVLTALRTAATSALAARYLAPNAARRFGIVGTGAQSEFQVLAHHAALGTNEVYYYDLDAAAMDKFTRNLQGFELALFPCKSAEEVVNSSEIITTATAYRGNVTVLDNAWLPEGVHINAIGGDCPGKTEIDPVLTKRAKIVVELLDQTKTEGEIQHLLKADVHAELWELVKEVKVGRTSQHELTLFDSVGCALEDYSILRLVYALAEEYQVGHVLDMLPDIEDPKNLFGLISA